jgi:hypothetical protein
MPTGYTHAIKDGITFQQFAIGCARAFGACIDMREDPSDAPIPSEFLPSDYHLRSGKEAQERLTKLHAMKPEEWDAAALKEYLDGAERDKVYQQERIDLRNKYQAMLAEVVKWEPPTSDHIGLQEFMAQQIRDSINFDCGEWSNNAPRLSGADWIKDQIENAEADIVRHADEYAEEIERTNERNQWIKALRESLS